MTEIFVPGIEQRTLASSFPSAEDVLGFYDAPVQEIESPQMEQVMDFYSRPQEVQSKDSFSVLPQSFDLKNLKEALDTKFTETKTVIEKPFKSAVEVLKEKLKVAGHEIQKTVQTFGLMAQAMIAACCPHPSNMFGQATVAGGNAGINLPAEETNGMMNAVGQGHEGHAHCSHCNSDLDQQGKCPKCGK